MSHQKSGRGVRYSWRLKWTSKKPNCCRRLCIQDFATTNENSCVCYNFNSMRWTAFLREECNWEILLWILAGRRAWASLCSPRIRAGPDAELGKVPSGEELQPQQELWVMEAGARFESAPWDSRMLTTNCSSRLPLHLKYCQRDPLPFLSCLLYLKRHGEGSFSSVLRIYIAYLLETSGC